MLDAREIGLTAQRELRRNLRSTKGIAMFALFLLGGLLVNVVIPLMMRGNAIAAGIADAPDEAKAKFFGQLYGSVATGEYLARCPDRLHGLFQGTTAFIPLFALLVGFDQIAGDIQHRTIRYTAGRATRPALVIGKALGTWGVIATMVLVLHVATWITVIAQGMSPSTAISWGVRLWLFAVLSAAPYVGFVALMSSLVRTPIVALFIGAGAGAAVGLTGVILAQFERTKALYWGFPGSYTALVLSAEPTRVLGGFAAYVAWGGACVALAALIITRKDI